MRYARFLAPVVVAAPLLGQPPGFPSLAGINAEMGRAAKSFPKICSLVDLTAKYRTPKTHRGRSIFAVKISDNVAREEDEPTLLIVAAHHGNEYGTPIVALDAIARLTKGYGKDPVITALVDANEIWIAPVWNVDGYPTSRRNARPGGSVDLNRNYPFLWASACNTGIKGPSPASEPETRTMVAWAEDQRFTKVLDYHSSGRETLHGYRCNVHRLASYLRNEAIALSKASSYGGRNRGPSSNGEHYQWQLGNFSNYAFLTEISNTQRPSRASADAEAARLWPGTVWMLQRAIPVQGHVTDSITKAPLAANISYVENPFTQGERNRSEPRFGRYHAFLPNGRHTLRFSHPGHATRDVPVTVTSAGIKLDVALVPLLSADVSTISLVTGGTQKLALNTGTAQANQLYWMLGSITGTRPGITVGSVHVPLNPDSYTGLTIDAVRTSLFSSFTGRLDSQGRAAAALHIPSGLPRIPITLHHAFVVFDGRGLRLASNAVPVFLK